MRAGNTPSSLLAGMPLNVPGALAGQLLGVVSERRQPDCTAQGDSEFAGSVAVIAYAIIEFIFP